jgi:hypothetical protein
MVEGYDNAYEDDNYKWKGNRAYRRNTLRDLMPYKYDDLVKIKKW